MAVPPADPEIVSIDLPAGDSIPEDAPPTLTLFRRDGFPRPPGVYPANYPRDRQPRAAPEPGESISAEPSAVAPHATPRSGFRPVSCVCIQRYSMDRRLIMGPDVAGWLAKATAFPPVDVDPPKFKPRSLDYPSGNVMGTAVFQPFADSLKKLILAGTAARKLH
jgi:hypothetical protein